MFIRNESNTSVAVISCIMIEAFVVFGELFAGAPGRLHFDSFVASFVALRAGTSSPQTKAYNLSTSLCILQRHFVFQPF